MTCDLCERPIQPLWQDVFCRVVLLNDVDYPAYCRVELIAHVKEMTDLQPTERTRVMNIVFAVETAMREMFNPTKINLASLGNKTPHVHWHVIPRFENDKHFPSSHWGEALREGVAQKLDEKIVEMLKEKITMHISDTLNSV